MARPRLLFLHTGGTLGMTAARPGPLAPGHYDETVLPYVRGLEELADIDGRVVCNLDSSDMTPSIWGALGAAIADGMSDYDGFVVLHGTDTMAWTASALSFMLRGLRKPVVVTGSQRPIAQLRTDARSNLVHSTLCATLPIPEVGLYFGSHLFRGNRTTKVSIASYDAFESPDHPPLVSMGVDVQLGAHLPGPTEPFRLATGFCPDVAVLTPFPGMRPTMLRAAVDAGARAVLLRAFGDGNLPRTAWPDAVRAATDAGVAIVVTTQCTEGGVSPGRYENSAALADAGALFAGDLTDEAAVVKLMWLLGQGADAQRLRRVLLRPVAGECASG
jgi:L-asparaginase